MATVKEQVGEVLLGTTEEPQLSHLTRASFLRFAKEAEDGKYYLNEEDFIDAVAPESEDYVCPPSHPLESSKLITRPTAA